MRRVVGSPLTPSAIRVLQAAAAFHAGIVLAGMPVAAATALAALVVISAILIDDHGAPRPGRGPRTAIATLLIAAIAGVVVARLAVVAGTNPAGPAPGPGAGDGFQATVTGLLTDLRRLPPDRIELLIRGDRIETGAPAAPPVRPRGIRITLPDPAVPGHPPPWRPGDRLRLSARLWQPRAFGNPEAFDYPAWLRARGIGLVGSVKSPLLVEGLGRSRNPFAGLSGRVRAALVRRIERAAQPGSASFLTAILTGERSTMAPEIEEPLQRAGVYHIIALSGLNVAWLAAVVSIGARLAAVPPPWVRGLVLAALAGYWWVAPGSGSMTRASLMGILYIGGRSIGRRVTPAAALGVAALLMLIVNPAWSVDAGFQLSLAATLGILVAGRPPVPGRPGRGVGRVFAPLIGATRVSAAAIAGTLLIGAHHFHRLSPAALPANLVAVPAAALLLALAAGLAAIGAGPRFLADPMALLADRTLAVLVDLCDRLARLPGMEFRVLPPDPLVAAGAIAALVVGAAAGRRAARLVAHLLLAVLAAATVVAGRGPRPPGPLRVVALDVGQGDAILVELPSGGAILVDAGGRARGGFDLGDRVVAPALRALGRLRIDLLIVTHAHQDHLGGAEAILRQFRPEAVWFGRMPPCDPRVRLLEAEAAALRIPVIAPRAGLSLHYGGVGVAVLGPAGPDTGGPAANDDSIVVLLRYGGRGVLLTGDIESEVERRLVEGGASIDADLLKVAHHGSRSSSGPWFLARVRPRLAIISSGRGNLWGHPDPVVIERLREAGARVLRTDLQGAVCVQSDGRGPWTGCGRPFRGPPVP